MSTELRTYYRGHDLVTMRPKDAALTRTYHFDHQGTTQCLTDPNGAPSDRFACDAWGVEVRRMGTSTNRHWYIGALGYYHSQSPDPYYVRARYLSALQGSWLSRDPLLHDHPYAYANGLPSATTDATGLVPRCFVSSVQVAQNEPWERPPIQHAPTTEVCFARLFRAVAEVVCVVDLSFDDCQCPAPPEWTWCQAYSGSWTNGRKTVISLPPKFYCPDNDWNDDVKEQTGGVTTTSCLRQYGWEYGGIKKPIVLVKSKSGPANPRGPRLLECVYKMCMADAPGEHEESPFYRPALPEDNCYQQWNAGSIGYQTRPDTDFPIEINLSFKTWVCSDAMSGRPAPGPKDKLQWSLQVIHGGRRGQRVVK